MEKPLIHWKIVLFFAIIEIVNERNPEVLDVKTKEQLIEQILTLQDVLKEKEVQIAKLEKLQSWYIEQLKLRQKEKFGKSSEQLDESQLSLFDLFNEAEELREPIMAEPGEDIIVVPTHKRSKKRGLSYKDLPVETIEYKLKDEVLECPSCQAALHVMTKETRKELKVIPAQISVLEHVTYVYSCRNCEKTGTEGTVQKATSPKALIPKSMVSPSMLAYIMNQKYTLALPLYRQEQEWNRLGVKISRQNLSNWILKGANLLLPLGKSLKEELIHNQILHADETTLEVLQEPGRDAHTKSYMWLYATPKNAKRAVVMYDYQIGRSGTYAKQFLKDWNGNYLCCDGYVGYRKLEDIKLCGCYAHLRRYFHDAYKVADNAEAKQCLDYLSQLFAYERFAEEQRYSAEQRLQMRNEKYPAILEQFYEYIGKLSLKTLPKSLLGKAIGYANNQKHSFYTMLEDGNIELTNSRAERFIKMFVIGRKNFLFSNTPNGARSSALIYSVIQTAIANGLKPMDYLQYVFEKIQENADVDIKQLLPWSEDIPQSCKNIKANS